MNRTEKVELAATLKDQFNRAQVAIFSDYIGLKASQADTLRRALREHNAQVKVIKNNVGRLLTKDGALGSDAQGLMDSVVGPTLVTFAFGDPAAAAKVVHKFAKENEAFKIKDSLMGSRRIKAAEVEALATLPSREVLLATLLGTMNAPIQNFVGVLAAVPRSLVTVLAAIEKKKANPEA